MANQNKMILKLVATLKIDALLLQLDTIITTDIFNLKKFKDSQKMLKAPNRNPEMFEIDIF